MKKRDLAAEFHQGQPRKKAPGGRPKGSKDGYDRTKKKQKKHDIKARAIELLNDPQYLKNLRKRLREGTCPSIENKLYDYAHGKPREQGLGEGDLQKQLDQFRAEALKALLAARPKALPPSQVKMLTAGTDGEVVDAERA